MARAYTARLGAARTIAIGLASSIGTYAAILNIYKDTHDPDDPDCSFGFRNFLR
ncbi:MAG TPA: hypothetical protein VIH75_24140 [Candidatus Sulfotelmatobacter sp.]